MKNGIVTAALVIIGFTVPLALAWHHGDFQADEPEVVASAPVRLASAAPVEATALPAQVTSDANENAEPPSTPPEQVPEQVDASPPPSDDSGPVDEAREDIRTRRQH